MLHKKPLHTRNTRSSSYTMSLLNRPAHTSRNIIQQFDKNGSSGSHGLLSMDIENHVIDHCNTSEEESLDEEYCSDDDTSENLINKESDTGVDEGSGTNDDDDDDAVNNNVIRKFKVQNTVELRHVIADEYAEDSSDEEDIRNTVGNIPLEWYNNYDHLGYDIHGNKIIKPDHGDRIDDFLDKMQDPHYWRTVTDKWTGQKTVLKEEDVDIIRRIQRGAAPSRLHVDYPEWIDFVSGEEMIHPVTNRPMDKRSFIPSKWEKLKVGQMVHAINMGWMKPHTKKSALELEEGQHDRFDLWEEKAEDSILKRYRMRMTAPQMTLPGHAESYNPPPEYLFNKLEEEKWKAQDPEDRCISFMPLKYSCLRLVPAYSRFINERFERCLDLYLCARKRKQRMNVNPEDLIPDLPKPKDLQPFPHTEAFVYVGHTDMVRCISPSPCGQWLASGSDDCTVRLWEVLTGRCMKVMEVDGVVKSLAWNPNPAYSLLAVAFASCTLILNPGLGDRLVVSDTDQKLLSFDYHNPPDRSVPVSWTQPDMTHCTYLAGIRLKLEHPKEVAQVTWHIKGDYFATVMHKGEKLAVIIHHLSKRVSQSPFTKTKGWVQCVRFHPVRPILFVATQRFVRMYDLVKQQLVKKMQTNCQWVSDVDIHPAGDNIIISSYDCKTSWFDLDLSTKPYHTLKHHKRAVRQVAYHRNYPLFASASDDGTVIVCHGKVFNDLLKNPLIVPVKILRGHKITRNLGVMACTFHPFQPWIFSAGADCTVRLYHC